MFCSNQENYKCQQTLHINMSKSRTECVESCNNRKYKKKTLPRSQFPVSNLNLNQKRCFSHLVDLDLLTCLVQYFQRYFQDISDLENKHKKMEPNLISLLQIKTEQKKNHEHFSTPLTASYVFIQRMRWGPMSLRPVVILRKISEWSLESFAFHRLSKHLKTRSCISLYPSSRLASSTSSLPIFSRRWLEQAMRFIFPNSPSLSSLPKISSVTKFSSSFTEFSSSI